MWVEFVAALKLHRNGNPACNGDDPHAKGLGNGSLVKAAGKYEEEMVNWSS